MILIIEMDLLNAIQGLFTLIWKRRFYTELIILKYEANSSLNKEKKDRYKAYIYNKMSIRTIWFDFLKALKIYILLLLCFK